ncbi:MAG: precorrin-6Y C5,15-methyltransferase (decarboxylating) subunit CbiT [Fusobacteriaceae bacterium]
MGHIYDKDFIVGAVPLTKQEVRAVSISKLDLKEDTILIDVGAGTGSIGIEGSTYIKKGQVFAIEKERKGCDLINANKEKFSCDNLTVIEGRAPENIPEIPYDRMFIGGSTGSLKEILEHFIKYSKDNSKLVINIIALETLSVATAYLKELKFKEIEICNVSISRGRKIGAYTMMYGENPIYVITAVKGEKDE